MGETQVLMKDGVHSREHGRVTDRSTDVTEISGDAEVMPMAITDRLRENPEWFLIALRSLGDAVVAGDEKGRVAFLNSKAEALTGWKLSEACGRRLQDVLRLERTLADVSPSGGCAGLRPEARLPDGAVEALVIARDGSLTPVEARSALIREGEGPILGVVRVLRDATGRRRAEENLRRLEQRAIQAQKMEAVSRLAGGIAHDFNNLLTAINGYADFLKQSLGAASPLTANVDGILSSVGRAASLTRQLLGISRQKKGQPRRVEPNAVIAGMLPSLTHMLEETITLDLDLAPSPGAVLVDPAELEQALAILIANAREAMPQGGRLSLRTAESGAGAGREVIVTVADSGCGMDEATMSRLFEPFFTTKPVGKGMGLGLSTVYALVKQAGGDIQVDSAPGRGSAFRLAFPRLEPGEGAEPSPQAVTGASAHGETILLVEDDEEVRFLLYSILRSDGYNVLEARDGEQALEIAGRHAGPIHLILTDVHMPKLGGRRLVETLLPRHPGMKAMFMSGFSQEDLATGEQGELPITFLQKPFMPKSMLRQIRKSFGG